MLLATRHRPWDVLPAATIRSVIAGGAGRPPVRAVTIGRAIEASEVQPIRLAPGATADDNYSVARLQRLRRHADLRQFAPVVELDPPLLRRATRLPDLQGDKGIKD